MWTKKRYKITYSLYLQKFDTRYSLLLHHKTHANDEVKSKYRNLMVEDEEGHRCLLCETRFSIRGKLLAHVQRHMNVIEGIYHCKVCGLVSNL